MHLSFTKTQKNKHSIFAARESLRREKKSPDWLIPILCQCAKTKKKNTSGLPVSRVLTVYAARRARFAQGVVLDLSNGHTTAGWHPRKRIRLRRFCTYATDSHHQKGYADGCCVAHLAVCRFRWVWVPSFFSSWVAFLAAVAATALGPLIFLLGTFDLVFFCERQVELCLSSEASDEAVVELIWDGFQLENGSSRTGD